MRYAGPAVARQPDALTVSATVQLAAAAMLLHEGVERGLRRVTLTLSLAAALVAGWFGYDSELRSRVLQVCVDVPAARRAFPGKSDVDALALYHERHNQFWDAQGRPADDPSVIAGIARARAESQARTWAAEPYHGPIRQALTVGLWSLVAVAGPWLLFFFAHWIVIDLPGDFRTRQSLREWRPPGRGGSHAQGTVHRRTDGHDPAGSRSTVRPGGGEEARGE